MSSKGWDHQERSWEATELDTVMGFGYFFDPGLGKTYASIETLRRKMNRRKGLMRTLIFTPPLVVPQFREEWFKFTKIAPNQVTSLHGPGTKRLKDFRAKKDPAHIFVTNHETLLMKELFAEFVAWKPEAIIFDESHRFKNPSAQRSKLGYELANPWDKVKKCVVHKPYTYMLSGTPVLNSPLDIFQQIKIMLGGWPTREYFESMGNPRFLIDNFFVFRARYFRDKNAAMPKDRYFPDWQPATLQKDGFDGMGEIQEILSRISIRAKKEDALDLPDEISIVRKLPMGKEQARVYKEMKNDFISYLGRDRAAVATLAITKALRLMQIVSGFVSTEGQGEEDDKADIRFTDTGKDEELENLLEEIAPHHKVLVWAVWKENYAQIRRVCEKLGLSYVEAHGGISDSKKRENVERFKTDPTARVYIGHPGSGGIGLNLVCAPYDIFYSRTFSLEHYLQARARNHRGGQVEKVTHYDLACENTIDTLVLDKLAAKIELGSKMLGDFAKELANQI